MKKIHLSVIIAAAAAGSAGAGFIFEGMWGTFGSGNGQFHLPAYVALGPGIDAFVADSRNHRVRYFTSSGPFLGKWGAQGSANGQFYQPISVAAALSSGRVYVADSSNHRIQYFRDEYHAVTPASLGRVKAVFK